MHRPGWGRGRGPGQSPGRPRCDRRRRGAGGETGRRAAGAATAGTATGLGGVSGEGDGLGVGRSRGVGVGLGEAAGEAGDCLAWGASGPLAVQDATAARATRRTTPFLTVDCNEKTYGRVTRFRSWRKSHTIAGGRLVVG